MILSKTRKLLSWGLSVIMVATVAALPVQAVTDNTQGVGYYNQGESYATYNGSDLGATYSKASTTFKVWAPSASKVVLNLYKTGSDSEAGAGKISSVDMSKDNSNGVWSLKVNGDQNKIYYTYSITVNGTTNETQDVYSTATGVNGTRSMVVDLDTTDPSGWSSDSHMLVDKQTDATIWEVQVRDFSISSSSGVSANNKGKYLAFTESGTKVNGSDDVSTCVDYLVEQGVNYVHLNPVYDFGSIDETNLSTPQYNWGYDPVNYNVPEGSFSTNPYNGEVRIKEFKEMVQALHNRGIGVVMDVVYNHTYSTSSAFEKTVPGYYYRMKSSSAFYDGSGCGNVTASDKAMYRKYMIDSVMYWANEYHIDGFRFDLMGCHDITTMNQLRASLDTIDKRILTYGEPWMADWNQNGIATSDACILDNASKVNNRVAMFSDKVRNALKGGTDDSTQGYIQGSTTVTNNIKAGMMGGSSTTFGKWALQPSQCVTYDSAHDNLTLWDKILKSNGSTDYNGTNSTFLAQNKLSAAIVLTSQGIPFYLAGEEFARTKNGDHNSYKSSDSVNQLDWTRVSKYKNLVDYYKGLMKIRSSYSPFRAADSSAINTTYFTENGSAIGYTIQNTTSNASKEWGTVAVLTNNSSSDKSVALKSSGTLPTSWVVVANGDKSGVESLGTVSGTSVNVPARSAMVLVDSSTFGRLAPDADYKTITVKHIEKSTGTILKTTTSKSKAGTTYSTSADTDLLADYLLVGTDGVTSGTVSEDTTVTYFYEKDSTPSYTLTVNYVDNSGAVVAATKTSKIKSGKSYTATVDDIDGYELDTEKLPANAGGILTADTTVNFVYKAVTAQNLTVHYYNANNWSKPCLYAYDDSGSSTVLLSGKWPGTAMTADTASGAGWWTYPAISTKSGKVMFTDGGSQQEPGASQPGYSVTGEVWIKNSATSFSSRVVVSYINQQGQKLADDVTVDGKMVTASSTYTTQGISGYGEPVAVIGNASGTWSTNVQNIIYVYNGGVEPPTVPPTEPPTVVPVSFYVLGDANFDGDVTLKDAISIQRHIAKINILTDIYAAAADIDGNLSVTLRDAVYIQQHKAGITIKYPVGSTQIYRGEVIQ
ncbi:MAG TPA: type I pullulanase [Clostridiales bacterium]|nr:type I pullulanase [Clostridiales bacterium]